MKKPLPVFLFVLFSLMLVSRESFAQRALPRRDCYSIYKSQGDSFFSRRNYDLAIQQYQNAKYCPNLTPAQKKTLDSLIVVVNRSKPVPRAVTRKKT